MKKAQYHALIYATKYIFIGYMFDHIYREILDGIIMIFRHVLFYWFI